MEWALARSGQDRTGPYYIRVRDKGKYRWQKLGFVFSLLKANGVERSSRLIRLPKVQRTKPKAYSAEELTKLFAAMTPEEYLSLFIQARGALKQELIQRLRSKRRIRRSRHASVHGHCQGKIVDAISIRERPAEVEDRAVPGHWEGDLLRGARNSHVATLVERHSRFCMLVKVPGKDTATVAAALSQHVQQLPAALRCSLAGDRGLEMAQHKSFTTATDVQVYFDDRLSQKVVGAHFDHFQKLGVGENDLFTLVIDDDGLVQSLKGHFPRVRATAAEPIS